MSALEKIPEEPVPPSEIRLFVGRTAGGLLLSAESLRMLARFKLPTANRLLDEYEIQSLSPNDLISSELRPDVTNLNEFRHHKEIQAAAPKAGTDRQGEAPNLADESEFQDSEQGEVSANEKKDVDSSRQESADFWKSPIPIRKTFSARLKAKTSGIDTLPKTAPSRMETRDGQVFKVTVLPGYNGTPAPLPEVTSKGRTTRIGAFEVGGDGMVSQRRPTSTPD